jgi:hypothetical protein
MANATVHSGKAIGRVLATCGATLKSRMSDTKSAVPMPCRTRRIAHDHVFAVSLVLRDAIEHVHKGPARRSTMVTLLDEGYSQYLRQLI